MGSANVKMKYATKWDKELSQKEKQAYYKYAAEDTEAAAKKRAKSDPKFSSWLARQARTSRHISKAEKILHDRKKKK